jgi:hypothetical protein
MTSLWLEASRDIEADEAELSFNKAKIATASLWPFLALANSEEEFEHRLALAIDQIERRIPRTASLQRVVDSFRDDYKIYREAADAEDEEPDDDSDDVKPWEKEASVQVFHEASQQWVTVTAAAEPTPGNPNFPNPSPEEGPITEETGNYPQHPTGADPVDPINQMFPMQPTPWQEKGLWVDRPMNFAPYQNPGNYGAQKTSGTRVTATDYQGEGVQTGSGPNPFYFAGGEEGVAGDQQAGFPADQTNPASQSDDRVDMYGAVPPLASSGTTGDGHPYSNQGNLNTSKESAKDNHGACYDCKQPVYRHGNEWHHLGQPPQNGHSVRLPSDHPWVQARMSSIKHTAPGGGEHAPYEIREVDGGYAVFNAKGERKNDDPKSKSEARQFQKALYKNVPGASESAEKAASLQFYADASSTDMGSGDPVGGGAPEPPPSMTPGGPGTLPQPPVQQAMTIPNESVTQNPFPNEPAGGGGGGMNMNPFMGMASIYRSYDQFPDTARSIIQGSVTRKVADAQTRDRPDMFNPTGAGDEFTERTWNGQVSQSPRQPMEERNVNTPQRPPEAIPQNSSNGGPREEEDED